MECFSEALTQLLEKVFCELVTASDFEDFAVKGQLQADIEVFYRVEKVILGRRLGYAVSTN